MENTTRQSNNKAFVTGILKEKNINFKTNDEGKEMASGYLLLITNTPSGKGEVKVSVSQNRFTTDGKEKRDIPVDNCVKWSEDEGFHYAGDDSFALTESQMKKYLSPDKDENTGNIITDEDGNPVYTNIQKGYTYTYVVPSFF